jgi:hypothetical protein
VQLAGGFEQGSHHFVARVLGLIGKVTLFDAATVGLNLLREVAWNNPVLPVLLLFSLSARRTLPLPLKLSAVSIAITLLVVLVMLPSQDHGWGYRYVQCFLGPLCLIAAHGWIELVPASVVASPAPWRPLFAACIFMLLALLPAQAWQVHAFIDRHRSIRQTLSTASADVVVMDDRGLFYGEDYAANDPFLNARPVFLNLEKLDNSLIDRLCARGLSVALFDRVEGVARGALLVHTDPLPDWPDGRRAHLLAAPCLTPLRTR